MNLGLVNKYAVFSGDEYYHTIRIVEQLHENTYVGEVLSYDDCPSHFITFHIGLTLAGIDELGNIKTYWRFFETEQKMREWLEWSNKPETDNVISLVKKEE